MYRVPFLRTRLLEVVRQEAIRRTQAVLPTMVDLAREDWVGSGPEVFS
jgi:hypothetical protein